MTERVLRDYLLAFRWQKIKESQKKGAWLLGFYFLFLMPLTLQIYDSLSITLLYFSIGTPLVFGMYVPTIHTMRLPKIMYLCPLNFEERKEYIIKSCAVRIAVSLLVDVTGVVVLLICGICDWIMAIGIFLNLAILSVAIGSGVNRNGFGKITEEGSKTIDSKNKEKYFEMWICLIAIFTALAHYVMVIDWQHILFIKIIAAGVPLVILLPPTIAYLQFWKQAVTETMTYER